MAAFLYVHSTNMMMGRPVFLNRINWDTNYKDCKMTLKLLNSFTKDPNAKQLCPQLVGNVLRNQFSVKCVQKREVSLWIIFQVRHQDARSSYMCYKFGFSSKSACNLKQHLLHLKLSHFIHSHFLTMNKQSERLRKILIDKNIN